MLLTQIKEGQKVKIKKIMAGLKFKKRLADLGLYEGTIVKVVRNDISGGPILLKVLDSKIALGRGQALKIDGEVL